MELSRQRKLWVYIMVNLNGRKARMLLVYPDYTCLLYTSSACQDGEGAQAAVIALDIKAVVIVPFNRAVL